MIIAVGIAWPNHLAAFAMFISVPGFLATVRVVADFVSLGGTDTDTGCAGRRWVETSQFKANTAHIRRQLSLILCMIECLRKHDSEKYLSCAKISEISSHHDFSVFALEVNNNLQATHPKLSQN